MNDTPRTNAMLTAILETHGHVGFLNCPPAWVAFSKELERELNKAKQHIERLEEEGDELLELCEAEVNQHHLADQIDARCKSWRKAKEAKP